MGRMKFDDKTMEFINQNTELMDKALGRMAQDIVVIAKIRMPYKGGDLQRNTAPERMDELKHRVVVNSEYGAVQEKGQRMSGPGAPTKKFKNYTTPGTGPHFLRDAGNQVTKDAMNYLKQAALQVKV